MSVIDKLLVVDISIRTTNELHLVIADSFSLSSFVLALSIMMLDMILNESCKIYLIYLLFFGILILREIERIPKESIKI